MNLNPTAAFHKMVCFVKFVVVVERCTENGICRVPFSKVTIVCPGIHTPTTKSSTGWGELWVN